jgi:hypothetical protein
MAQTHGMHAPVTPRLPLTGAEVLGVELVGNLAVIVIWSQCPHALQNRAIGLGMVTGAWTTDPHGRRSAGLPANVRYDLPWLAHAVQRYIANQATQ